MPIIVSSRLLKRAPSSASGSTGGINGVYIVGFAIAGVALFGIAIWLGIHFYRKRLAKKRRDNLGPAFLSVRGIVKEDELYSEKNTHLRPNPTPFSRENINSQIILPSKARLRSPPERENTEYHQTIEYHRQSGTFPKPFSFAFRTSGSVPTSPISGSSDRLSAARNSYAPSSLMSRFSVVSAASSYNDSLTTAGGNATRSIRKVRQVYNPVLPDELVITLGEQLMILQSFDDGWCVVGRESGLLMSQPKSLFGGASRTTTPTAMFGYGSGAGVGTTSGGNVELGMVPAWCFLKSVKGLRAERPMRSTSLGVTVQVDAPSGEREDVISWSNF